LRGGGDLVEGLDGGLEAFGRVLELGRRALRLVERVDKGGELDLGKGNVELEVQLLGGDGESL